MASDNTTSSYSSLMVTNRQQIVKSIAVTYVPILLIAINILVFRNVVLGSIATSSFLLFNGYVVYEKLRSVLGEIRWIGITIGAFIFLISICIVSSPFVLTSTFSLEKLVGIISISGVPIVIFRIRDNLSIIPVTWQKIEKISRYDLSLVAVWVALLISDLLILLSHVTSDSTFLWSRVPVTHVYLFFFFVAITGVILFRNINITVRSAIIVISIIFACSYAVIVVPTLYSNDTWFLLGEVVGSITPHDFQSTQSIVGQTTHVIPLGPFSIPEQYVTVWSRGISNTLALYSSQLFSDNSMLLWRSLSPIFALGTTAIILFRIGNLVSKNYLFSLLVPLSFVFYSGLAYFMSTTVKLSLSVPFFVLGLLFWVYFLLHHDKRTFVFALIVTVLNFVNYSLYFLILFDMMIISIFIRHVIPKYVISNRKLYSYLPLITAMLSLVIPYAQTLLGSSFIQFDFSVQLPKIINYVQSIFGYYLPDGISIPYDQFIITKTWYFISHVLVLTLVVIGALRFNLDKNIRYTLILIISTLYVSSYITDNLMTEPHALGYVTTVLHLLEIPFLAFGIFWLSEKSKQLLRNSIAKKMVIPVLCIVIAILVESAQIVETGSAWMAPSDLDATNYIVQHEKNNTDYALISNSWGSYPLYYLTGGEKFYGDFYANYVPGVTSVDRASYYYYNMQNSTDKTLLTKAENETNRCTIYYLKPSWLYYSPSQIRNVSSIMGLPLIFSDDHQKTLLFRTSSCSNNQANVLTGIPQANALPMSSSRYDETIFGYDKILETDKTNKNALIGKAQVLENSGRYSDALALYDVITKLYPDNVDAKAGQSRILGIIGTTQDYNKELTSFDKILETDKTNKNALIGKAQVLEKLGRYSDSFDIYGMLLKDKTTDSTVIDRYADFLYVFPIVTNFDNTMFSDDVKEKLLEALKSKAQYFEMVGYYDKLLLISNNMLSLDDSNMSAMLFKISALIGEKNYDVVMLEFDNLKNKVDVTTNSGLKDVITLEQNNEYDKSLAVYDKILENKKLLLTTELTVAKMFVDRGLIDQATPIYSDIHNVYESQVEIWNNITTISEKQGRLDLVIGTNLGFIKFDDSDLMYELNMQSDIFANEPNYSGLLLVSNEILSIDPVNERALKYKSASLLNLKDYDGAISALDVALSIDPANVDLMNEKASIYTHVGNYDSAITTYDQALAINPNNPDTLKSKASVLLITGKYDSALELINKILMVEPNNISAMSLQSDILVLLGKYDESLAIDDKIASLNPQSIEQILDFKYEYLVKMNNYDMALSVIDKLLILKPNDYQILYNKGFILEKLGRYDDAISTADEILLHNPNDTSILNAKANLLIKLSKPSQALDIYEKILSIDPSNTKALENKNKILEYLQSK